MRRYDLGDYTIEKAPSAVRPSDLDLDEVKTYVEEDPELTTRKISAKIKVSYIALRFWLGELSQKQKLGRWTPHTLSNHDNAFCVSQALSLRTFREKCFDRLNPIVTGDEKCGLLDNHVRYAQ